MNYCKSDGVSHNTATGFLNHADRLIIELQQRRQRSMGEEYHPWSRRRKYYPALPGGEKLLHQNYVLKQLPQRSPSLMAMK